MNADLDLHLPSPGVLPIPPMTTGPARRDARHAVAHGANSVLVHWRGLRALLLLLLSVLATSAHAQLAVDEVSGDGYLNPADTSWHFYVNQMNRFPDRLGIICVNGYELDKTGDHKAGFSFLAECAKRGNPPSMIYLAEMYAAGRGCTADPVAAAAWLRRAATTGYPVAQYHFGVALLLGEGVARDAAAAKAWLRKAADQGDDDAIALVRADFDPALAATLRPSIEQ